MLRAQQRVIRCADDGTTWKHDCDKTNKFTFVETRNSIGMKLNDLTANDHMFDGACYYVL